MPFLFHLFITGGRQMYQIIRVLNNNALLVNEQGTGSERILLGKGIGFGKKSNELVSKMLEAKEYTLTTGGKEEQAINAIEPVYLEAADIIIEEAEKSFGHINRGILFLLAEHIAFSVKRLKENIYIDNPFISDIKVMFMQEYMVARNTKAKVEALCGYQMSEGELGFIALHIHSGLAGEVVSETLRSTQIIDYCVQLIGQELSCTFDTNSLIYNRLVTHMYYLLERVRKNEAVNVELNSFIKNQYPDSWNIAKRIIQYIENSLSKKADPQDVGFLAIYIERLRSDR